MAEQHPAVVEAADLVGPDFQLLAVAQREEAVVALFQGEDGGLSVKRLVIVEQRDGEWRLPGVVGGTPRSDEPRRATTVSSEPFADVGLTQSGWPGPDGGPPNIAWTALTGVAAADVSAVRVETEHDQTTVEVGTDGRFLALVRAGWNTAPRIAVRMSDGTTREVST